MLTPDPKFTPNTPGSEKSDLGDSHSGEKSTRSDASRTRRLLDRQADALEQLVFVLDPSKKPKKRGVARFVGYMMLASSIVLGGYEFVSWVFEQWERRAMIANWLAVARDMQDVENAPELALELLEQANEVDPQNADVVRLRAYVRGMQAVKRLLQLDRPMSTEDVAIAAAAAAEASLLEQLDPNAPDWALLRGQLAMAQREPERARAYFETALSLDPENVLVRVRSADMHFEHGKSIETTDPVAAKEEFATAKRFLD
ncbi:MAG: tetratricopeptide repeat protein, partial [Limnohabitans sp.]|nr:tetratricopeptide repeat protein [Limnohabitans sp.]